MNNLTISYDDENRYDIEYNFEDDSAIIKHYIDDEYEDTIELRAGIIEELANLFDSNFNKPIKAVKEHNENIHKRGRKYKDLDFLSDEEYKKVILYRRKDRESNKKKTNFNSTVRIDRYYNHCTDISKLTLEDINKEK